MMPHSGAFSITKSFFLTRTSFLSRSLILRSSRAFPLLRDTLSQKRKQLMFSKDLVLERLWTNLVRPLSTTPSENTATGTESPRRMPADSVDSWPHEVLSTTQRTRLLHRTTDANARSL